MTRTHLALLRTLLALLLACPTAAGAVELTRDNWHAQTRGQAWFVKFYQQGCTHCQRMAPMWEAVAEQLPQSSSMRVGKVDCTAHNGIGRSFGVDRFPYVLLIDADGAVYEYTGRRGLPPLLSFARGGFRKQAPMMQAPAELLADASDAYLLLLALWRPLAMSLGLALGVALCLKGGALLLLRLLRRTAPKEPKDRAAKSD